MTEKEFKQNPMEAMGWFLSRYPATVHDNNDPENCFRLKLKCPYVFVDNRISDWALPCGVYAGKDYGIFALPQKGDNVWISFRGGDVNFPIWEYGAIAKKEKPTQAAGKSLVFISPKGNKIVIDENGKIDISNEQTSLKECIEELFDWLENAKVIIPTGLAPFSPDVITLLIPIKEKFNSLLS